jgi:hypothetical protein
MNSKNLSLYGGSPHRRSLESPERKSFRVTQRRRSETRFMTDVHMMQKPSTERLRRSYSSSPYRKTNENIDKSARIERNLNIDLINRLTGLNFAALENVDTLKRNTSEIADEKDYINLSNVNK